MRISVERKHDLVALRPRQIWSANLRAGQSVRCERGVLWLTQSGEARDIILRVGQRWTAKRRGLAVAQAMGDSRLAWTKPRPGGKYLEAKGSADNLRARTLTPR